MTTDERGIMMMFVEGGVNHHMVDINTIKGRHERGEYKRTKAQSTTSLCIIIIIILVEDWRSPTKRGHTNGQRRSLLMDKKRVMRMRQMMLMIVVVGATEHE